MKRPIVFSLFAALLFASPAGAAEPVEWHCSPTACTALQRGVADIDCRSAGPGFMTCSPWRDFVAKGRSAVATGGVSLPGRIRMTAALVDCTWHHGPSSGRCLDGPVRTSGIGRWQGIDGTTSVDVVRRVRIPAFRLPIPGFHCTTISIGFEIESTASMISYQAPVDSVTAVETGGYFTTMCV